MTFKNAQEQVDNWISQFKEGYWKPHEIMVRLLEETGELAREINHTFGPKKKKSIEEKKDMESEIGDIIFTLCCLANSQGIDLKQCFQRSIDKCHGRDSKRFERIDA